MKISRVFGIASAVLGFGILAYVLLPILFYEIEAGDKFYSYLSPIPISEDPFALEFTAAVDYTKASNWFEGENENIFKESKITYYTLSIPSLGIEKATVSVGGEDLADSLIQYPGTALPGKKGNSVVFGHSALPQFFDPKNYISIFSTLPALKVGEMIYVDYDSVSYKYEIEDMFEVKPDNLEVLEQNFDSSYITLVTCTPPGHPLKPKRLIVRARLVPYISKLDDNYWN